MNKDLLDQIPAEEQPIASKLNFLAEDMQPSQVFQWDLENQLMDKAETTQPSQGGGWIKKIMVPLGWSIAALCGVLLLNWTVRSFVPQTPPAAGTTATPQVSFVESVRAGNICVGPLAVGHGFSVFLSNPEKTRFAVVDAGNPIGEMRSFTWSPDGKHLTIVGNTMGSGNVLLTDPVGGQVEDLLSSSGVGYPMDAAWSRDGKQLAMWSSQNNTILYVWNAEETGVMEKQLDVHILGTPQFLPDGSGIVFLGATSTSAGLFEMRLEDSEAVLINPLVRNGSGYAFSRDGSYLAYMEYDQDTGEARLIAENLVTHERSILGTLPIPKGSGSSLPDTANLSWSADGKSLVFDFGRHAIDRAIYLAHADGTGMIKVADAAYAPSISADGKCLAYISEGQVFLMDLSAVVSGPTAQPSVLLADLPTGRGIPNVKQDKLQWKP